MLRPFFPLAVALACIALALKLSVSGERQRPRSRTSPPKIPQLLRHSPVIPILLIVTRLGTNLFSTCAPSAPRSASPHWPDSLCRASTGVTQGRWHGLVQHLVSVCRSLATGWFARHRQARPPGAIRS